MFLNTARIPWVSLRDNVTSDDSAITTFIRSNWPSSNTVSLNDPPLHDANALTIIAFGTDTANDNLTSYKLYGITRDNGPILLLLTGVMTLGTQVATTHPIGASTITNGKWVDTITVTGGFFAGANQHEIHDNANNRIAGLSFDQRIIDELYLEIDLNNINAFYAIICGY